MKKKLTFWLHFSLLLLALSACIVPVPATLSPVPTTLAPTSTLTPTTTVTLAPTWTIEPTVTPFPTSDISSLPTNEPSETVKRVFILSLDGLRPGAISLAPMPNLMALMDEGAFSLTAQTIFPSATLPSHASMLTGLCPSKHGVYWNDYYPELGYAQGVDLFDLAKAAGLETVMYVGKQKLRQIAEPESTDIFEFINDRDLVITAQLLADFPENFGVLFVHFPTGDWMGHEYGWLSDEQLSVYRRADEALGMILEKFDQLGLRDETLIIVTADHGGHGTSHGSTMVEDMTIPWIVAGPGVVQGGLLTRVFTMDTAATAAFALGLPIPPEWDGIYIQEAFGKPYEERPSEICTYP